jgi:hypothetical protein
MQPFAHLLPQLSRRRFLSRVGGFGLTGLLGASAWDAMAESLVKLPFANGQRDLVANFPQKRAMLLQRTRPPLLETPFEVFDQGAFTPNDRFYVRWHLANIPSSIDPATFGLDIRGHVPSSQVEALARYLYRINGRKSAGGPSAVDEQGG